MEFQEALPARGLAAASLRVAACMRRNMDAAQPKRDGFSTALASDHTYLDVADRPKALDLSLFKLEHVLSDGIKTVGRKKSVGHATRGKERDEK